MIQSLEEYLQLFESDDPQTSRRIIVETASNELWQEIVVKRPDLKEWVVLNKSIPLAILDSLAHDQDPKIRSYVAAKRKLSFELLELLAVDPVDYVRRAVAYNRSTPSHILEKLINDEDTEISDQAARRLGATR